MGFADWRAIPPARRKTMVWPREHGAWGILLVALITGSAIGFWSATNVPRLLWLALAVVAIFCLRTPLENSFPASPYRPRSQAEWRWLVSATLAYALIGASAIVILARNDVMRLLWAPGVAAVGLFALQAGLKRIGRAGRLPAEVIGAFGLTLTAVAGWAVAEGRIGHQALAIWILNALFATDQILYIQLRIREGRGAEAATRPRHRSHFLAIEATILALLIAGARAGFIPSLTLAAFAPVFLRGAAWSFSSAQRPLQIHRLGKSELAYAILFGVFLIAGFRLPIR